MDNAIKILLVDDDEFLLDMYSLKFKEAQFMLDVATSGEMALEKLRKNTYDVMLLDIVMPVLDGFEVLQQMRKENLAKDTLVIILSNLGQKEDIERGMQLGASDYIIKAHFTPKEVVEKVRQNLAKKKGV